ncbi:hypothetical protein [Yinghuangia sp. YIM S09857]|uniref:hypothetical protein n=1 Tax=Yinghuangia sp. YIM S09857 TaxID=3436929 RepID=UPI003F529BD8
MSEPGTPSPPSSSSPSSQSATPPGTPPASPAASSSAPFDTALLEEAAKKSGLLWIAPAAHPARPVWHTWHDGAVHILQARTAEAVEQHVPGLADAATAEATLRSKDKGGRLLTWTADVTVLTPDTPAWPDAAAALHADRLNAPDGEQQPTRWAQDCVIVRLDTPRRLTHGQALPDTSQSAPPPPTPATTRGPSPKNLSLGRKLRP